MSRYFDNVQDQYGRPVEGAQVYVYTQSEQLATIRSGSDAGPIITQPLFTGSDGGFEFYADDGLYSLAFYFQGQRLVRDLQAVVGDGPELPADIVAALASPGRAALIGSAGPSNVQADINARPTSSSLANGTGSVIGYRNPLAGSPAILRLLRSRLGEKVSVLDYCVGNDSADDTAAYQELVFRAPAEIVYPPKCSLRLSSTVFWLGNCEHRFHGDARIVGDVEGYAVRGLGYPDLSTITVTAPIAREANSFPYSGSLDLERGDDIYLYDVVTTNLFPNVVRAISGGVVYLKRPTPADFPNAANIRVYKLANACRNVTVHGGEFRNVRNSLGAHGLGFVYATDIKVNNTLVTKTGGIGFGFENSLRFVTRSVSAIDTGAVGLGARAVSDWRVIDYVGRNPGIDESFAFYKHCSFGEVIGADIEQYAFGEQPPGNPGTAGNCMLFDLGCSDVHVSNIRLRGSATYPYFVTQDSRRIFLDKFNISGGNLGGVRIGQGSRDCFVGSGIVTDVLNANDSEQGGIPTAAIQDDAGCAGNVLRGGRQLFRNIAGGVNVRQSGTAPAVSPFGAQAASANYAAGANPTKAEFDALVNALKNAGLMA